MSFFKPKKTDIRRVSQESIAVTSTRDLMALFKILQDELHCRARKEENASSLIMEETLHDQTGVSLRWFKTELIQRNKELSDIKCTLECTARQLAEVKQECFRLRVRLGEATPSEASSEHEAAIADCVADGDIIGLLKSLYGFQLPASEYENETKFCVDELMSQTRNFHLLLRALAVAINRE